MSALCWLAAVRGAGGAFGAEGSWLLQVHANLVALRVLQMLQNGVSVLGSRWGGQPVLCLLCARSPGCGCFCLRLDFQVTVSMRGVKGPGFSVLAFSVRTLKSSGVPRTSSGQRLLRGHVAFLLHVGGSGCFGSGWLGGGCRACTIDCLAFRLTAARAFLPLGCIDAVFY